jgi:hypothetical protein
MNPYDDNDYIQQGNVLIFEDGTTLTIKTLADPAETEPTI